MFIYRQSNNLIREIPISEIDSIIFSTQSDEEIGVVINGITWATRNVDSPGTFTANPEDAGMFYQWGSNVGWSSTNPLEASDGIHTWRNLSETGNVWKAEKDPCPPGWRVPTKAELESLISSGSEWKQKNGVIGRWFDNGRVFFPAAGYRYYSYGSLYDVGSGGNDWSSTPSSSSYACSTSFGSGDAYTFNYSRSNGFSVRCVSE